VKTIPQRSFSKTLKKHAPPAAKVGGLQIDVQKALKTKGFQGPNIFRIAEKMPEIPGASAL